MLTDLRDVPVAPKKRIADIDDANFPAPFGSGLEYGAPARGPWNIVHIGMLLPESHQIYVCAQSCLRGVVLTAAEMGATDRFSTVTVCEDNLYFGDMEDLIIEGVADILNRLPRLPRVVLIFTSCVHHFTACDLTFVYSRLREMFPQVLFTDCYMNPIMRKTSTPPDPMMRMKLYDFLSTPQKHDRFVTIVGNCFRTTWSDLRSIICNSGYSERNIAECRTFSEYRALARSRFGVAHLPTALPALKFVAERTGMETCYMPITYDPDEILRLSKEFMEMSGMNGNAPGRFAAASECFFAALRRRIGGTPITIDYTATPRPLELAEYLIDHGLAVRTVYADNFIEEDRPAFNRLRAKRPDLEICATVAPEMGVLPRPEDSGGKDSEKVIAIGQKAAYFCNTPNFVNMIEGGGMWGFKGLCLLAQQIFEAYCEPKDMKSIIQIKGWGCAC